MYCTTPNVKEHLAISGDGDDTLLERLITVSEATIDSHTGEKWVAAEDTKLFDAVRDVVDLDLIIRYHTAVSEVVNGDGQTLAATSYISCGPGRYNDRIRLKRNSGIRWSWALAGDPTNAIQVTADFGAATECPPEITQLAIDIVQWMYRARDTAFVGQILSVTRGGTILAPSDMPKEIWRRLVGFRRVF